MFWPVVSTSVSASAVTFAVVYGYWRWWPNRRYRRRVKDMAAMRDLLVHHVDDLEDIMDKLHHGSGVFSSLNLALDKFIHLYPALHSGMLQCRLLFLDSLCSPCRHYFYSQHGIMFCLQCCAGIPVFQRMLHSSSMHWTAAGMKRLQPLFI